MKKSISVILMLLLVLLNFSTMLSNDYQFNSTTQKTISMNNIQLQNIEGGLPAIDCGILLTTCMVAGGADLGWVGLLICSALAAYCLTV